MADGGNRESPDALLLRHALEKLRARDGLTRLESRAAVAEPLLRLAAVHRYAAIHQVELAQAAIEVVTQCVRDDLIDGTYRVVADAILALGLYSDAYTSHRVNPRAVDALRSDYLGNRRRYLLENWHPLHDAIGAAPGERPSDRSLRGSLEGDVLTELARQLIRREFHSLGSKSLVAPRADEGMVSEGDGRSKGRVVVVGGAVMDATFRTKELPQKETSTEAHNFTLSPGGKGLAQSIAAARLGLDVSLVAAVADDQFGREIIDNLEHEHVDTSLLKFVSEAHTPFTGVIQFELGDSVAVNWRNEREVRLDARDIDARVESLHHCDAVLVTFEIPLDTMQHSLALVDRAPEPRPVVIVTPGNPYMHEGIKPHAMAQIDYLVANAWELGPYAPKSQAVFDVESVVRRMLDYGVGTVCVPMGVGCTIYSETALGTFSVPTFPTPYKEESASRDAFCAALAAKLIENDGVFSEEVALWSTAALAAATTDYPISNSMPTRQRVEQILARSRFAVIPRPGSDDAAAAAVRPR